MRDASDEGEQGVDVRFGYEDAVPGKGSAIFLHCFGPTKPYTGGCVAVPEYTMQQVLKRVKKDCVVVMDTLENMNGKL